LPRKQRELREKRDKRRASPQVCRAPSSARGQQIPPPASDCPFIVDFAGTKHHLVIAADGGQHNENPADARRTAWLEAKVGARSDFGTTTF